MNIEMKIDNLTHKLYTYNGRLIHVEHKVADKEQEMLREGHVTLTEETRKLKQEYAKL